MTYQPASSICDHVTVDLEGARRHLQTQPVQGVDSTISDAALAEVPAVHSARWNYTGTCTYVTAKSGSTYTGMCICYMRGLELYRNVHMLHAQSGTMQECASATCPVWNYTGMCICYMRSLELQDITTQFRNVHRQSSFKWEMQSEKNIIIS